MPVVWRCAMCYRCYYRVIYRFTLPTACPRCGGTVLQCALPSPPPLDLTPDDRAFLTVLRIRAD